MSIEHYERAIHRFCEARGLEDPHQLMQGGLLSLDGYPLRIEFIEAIDRCRITIDLGPPPASAELACCRLLLQFNHRADGLRQPVMSLRPQTGHIRLGLHLEASELVDAEVLGEVIEGHLGGIIDAWEDALSELLERPPAVSDAAAQFPMSAQH